MRIRPFATLIGFLLLVYAMSLVPTLIVSLIYADEASSSVFGYVAIASATLGLTLWWPRRRIEYRLRLRDGFVVVTMFWLVLSLLSCIPFLMILHVGLADALFEAVSGFTTTGATVLKGLDAMPKSLLYYRQQLQWLGGIGVIVLTVAVIPMLGVGGMQMLKAETSGPFKDEKLTPRIVNTTRYLWSIYALFTAACAICYWLAGMSPFDAICHALSTLSTGGFSTHDASIAFFDEPKIEFVAIIFMFVGAVPFTIHYLAISRRSMAAYFSHVEVKAFVAVIVLAIVLTMAILLERGYMTSTFGALRHAAFAVVSVITSSGLGIADFSQWPDPLPAFMIYISCIGGCALSTAGGIKVVRFVILSRNASLQVERLIHPHIVKRLKLDGRVLSPKVTDAVWGFFATYVVVFALLMLVGMGSGLDQVSAFGAVATTLNNLGPGLGETSTSFADVADWMKYVFSFAMLLGRLELFTVMVLLFPSFWAH